MDGTEGLVRGQECLDMASPITIPVGPKTLGRIINVIGEPIDERGPVGSDMYANCCVFVCGGKGEERRRAGLLSLCLCVWCGSH